MSLKSLKSLESLKSLKSFLALIAVASLLFTACHKNCVCRGYDGGTYTYTAEELDERNVTCPNMIFQAGVQYYSICEWE